MFPSTLLFECKQPKFLSWKIQLVFQMQRSYFNPKYYTKPKQNKIHSLDRLVEKIKTRSNDEPKTLSMLKKNRMTINPITILLCWIAGKALCITSFQSQQTHICLKRLFHKLVVFITGKIPHRNICTPVLANCVIDKNFNIASIW